MITKDDCMTLLLRLEDQGLNINSYMRKLLISREIPVEVLKFISANRGSEVTNFYEMLRKRYNQKKTPLYKNILKESEDVKDIIITLVCLLTQISLYGHKLENKDIFLREVRAEEIARVIHEYYLNDNIEKCKALLKLIKSDLMVFEYLNGRRELN